ncbi:MAG: glycoside hydrolase family 30 beta sandwich domain-containing protein [Methylotenera sp.]
MPKSLTHTARPAWLVITCLLTSLIIAACTTQATHEPTAPIRGNGTKVQVWLTTTDRTKLLSREADVTFTNVAPLSTNIDIDSSKQYQEMVGFGAAITDASAWLMQNKMSEAQRTALLNELFSGAPNLGLSFTRLTIGASDFSRNHYSFDDMPKGQTDPTLAHFSIDANRADVLPTVKSALTLNPKLKVMASPWSAPAWMKTTDSLVKGSLRPEAYGAFSEYLARYIEAYTKEGVPIYAITLQNEPHFEPENYPGMRVDPAARASLIGEHIGPMFAQRGLNTRILDWDHNWDEPNSPLAVLADKTANRYVNGVAWHCYAGEVGAQNMVRNAFPNKDVYFTECSGGEWNQDGLTWLTRNLIIGATRNWAKGVLLWNMALDENHGPHLGGCGDCRGVVAINSSTGEVTRNAEYYVLAHASRFVRQGAHRIESSTVNGKVETVAFQNNDDTSLVMIAANSTASKQEFSVRYAKKTLQYTLPAKSIATFTWQP